MLDSEPRRCSHQTAPILLRQSRSGQKNGSSRSKQPWLQHQCPQTKWPPAQLSISPCLDWVSCHVSLLSCHLREFIGVATMTTMATMATIDVATILLGISTSQLHKMRLHHVNPCLNYAIGPPESGHYPVTPPAAKATYTDAHPALKFVYPEISRSRRAWARRFTPGLAEPLASRRIFLTTSSKVATPSTMFCASAVSAPSTRP